MLGCDLVASCILLYARGAGCLDRCDLSAVGYMLLVLNCSDTIERFAERLYYSIRSTYETHVHRYYFTLGRVCRV